MVFGRHVTEKVNLIDVKNQNVAFKSIYERHRIKVKLEKQKVNFVATSNKLYYILLFFNMSFHSFHVKIKER